MPGLPVHFHLIPLYDWVEELFWEDTLPDAPAVRRADHRTPTDGAELTLFVWREFCERADPPAVRAWIGNRRSPDCAGPSATASNPMWGWFFWRGERVASDGWKPDVARV